MRRVFLATGFLLFSSLAGAQSVPSCPEGTLLNVAEQRCAPIHDRRGPVQSAPELPSPLLNRGPGGLSPNMTSGAAATASCPATFIAAGVDYPFGTYDFFNVTSGIQTNVIVHPSGIGFPTNPACAVFETASNRTQMGVEVVSVHGAGTIANLAIFDWSCSAAYPCGAVVAPDYVWNKAENSTFLAPYVSSTPGFQSNKVILYVNEMSVLKPQVGLPGCHVNPFTCVAGNFYNQVLLYNYVTAAWDLVYSHNFSGFQADCAVSPGCFYNSQQLGWWGPIIESGNPNPQPPIKVLGFQNSYLWQNNSWVLVTQGHWTSPPYWTTYVLNPNYTWAVGSTLQQ